MGTMLRSEHVEIMKHTLKNGRFCGDSSEMKDLCKLGLMKSLGWCSFVPDEYFGITNKGKQALESLEAGLKIAGGILVAP